jgi:ABC-type lipoprotein release transport system permease subunit
MAFTKLWLIAFRDLGRNRRRSILTLIAVALGLALLMSTHGLTGGMVEETMQNTIRLQTGHVQVRAASYEQGKMSLQWKDLLENADTLAAQAAALPQVKIVTPVLWAGGVLNTADESAGLQVYGIDTTSTFYDPVRQAIVAGAFLAPDDRDGILIGKRLANSLGLEAGQRASLVIIDGDGQPSEAVFTIRGTFATGMPSYDESTAFLSLAKAQAFTNTAGRTSAVVILLNRQDDADAVAAALAGAGGDVLTWRELNAIFLQMMQTAMSFYILLDLIVILVVAVIIANTLLMAVFERIREMGILASLGMRGRTIMLMFLLEAATLGLIGIFVGIVLGTAGVAYLAKVGIPIGDMGTVAEGLALGSVMYARFDIPTFAQLSLETLVVILLAALYPARMAAHREPVEALRAL